MNRSKSRLRKTQCDSCGAILYGSAQALRMAGELRCGCGGAFQVTHAEDQAKVGNTHNDERLVS